MYRKYLPIAAVIVALLGFPGPAKALDPVSGYVLGYLSDKVVDEVWNAVTGKPDLGLLDRRLKDLEENTVMRGEMREEIRRLRASINDRVTREEFKAMAERVSGEIGSIKRRLDDLEQRVERLEVENEDLKNGTKNAASAEYFRKRGVQFSATDTERALANFNIAIKLDPSLAAAYQGRCGVYERLGAWGVVAADATEALAQPGLDPAWFHRERAIAQGKIWDLRPYHFTMQVLRSERRPLVQAEVGAFWSDCALSLAANPSDAAVLYVKGLSYLQGGDQDSLPLENVNANDEVSKYLAAVQEKKRPWYESAKHAFDAAIQSDKTSALAFCARGVANDRLKNYEAALADYSEAIRLDPQLKDAYVSRASIPNGPKQIADLTKALEIDPRDVNVLHARATSYGCVDEPRKEIEDLLRVIEIDPSNEQAYDRLDNRYYAIGEKEKSSRYGQKAFELREARLEARDARE